MSENCQGCAFHWPLLRGPNGEVIHSRPEGGHMQCWNEPYIMQDKLREEITNSGDC